MYSKWVREFRRGSSRGKFLTKGSTPRSGGRAIHLTLGHHYKTFGSARTARSSHGLDLAGERASLWNVHGQPERASARMKDRYKTVPSSV